MRKRIIFFDGDGTVYFPRESRSRINPKLLYVRRSPRSLYLASLVLVPGIVGLLKRLRENDVVTVLVSTHPHSPRVARGVLEEKLRHLKIIELFDEYHPAADRPGGKGEVILRVLSRRNIPKSKALMVGDSYRYDYLAAKRIGVDALLIETRYMKHPRRGPRIKNTIKQVSQLTKLL